MQNCRYIIGNKMNSSKEAKSVAKGQKKLQKINNKKQKQQQQQHQQQQQQQKQQQQQTINGIAKTAVNAKIKTDEAKPSNRNNNNNIINNINNNNNNINNNSSMVQNNNNTATTTLPTTTPTNITQKFREHYESERRAQQQLHSTLPANENLPKMERSNSIRGKLSRFINHITGSKENLARSDELRDETGNGKTPFTFTRSRSMILLRRPNRRSFIEPQLEQLSEEAEKSGDPLSPTSPRKNSLADSGTADGCSPILRRRADTASSIKTPVRRQSAHPSTSTPVEESESPMIRKPSLVSLTPSEVGYNPQLNFQKRRSSTLIASFKSTFSGLTGSGSVSGNSGSTTNSSDKKKDKMNPKWSASLQSLQAIDNMVSYANMSFIDYDKFNGYEKQLERQHSMMSLAEQQTPPMPKLPLPSTASPLPHLQSPHTPTSVCSTQESTPKTVVMRRKRSTNSLAHRQISSSSRNSSLSIYNLDTDYEHNLDKVQNVYRESLDSRTLELLNQCSRNSYIQDQPMLFDALNLEDGSASRRCALCAQRVTRANSLKRSPQDTVDGCGKPQKQLKSKSLTHLDGLDTVVPCHHEAAAPTATAPGTLLPPGTSAPIESNVPSGEKTTSSSEYFSVSFCLEAPQCPNEEFIPAIKGRTLLHALRQALDRRNLSFSQIAITDSNPSFSHLDAGAATRILDEHTDVENLAGHHLVVTEKDNSRKTLQKAASFGSRQRPPRLLSSASTEETSESTGKQIKQRWSSIFGIKNPQQSQLYELLNHFAKNGVPQRPDALGFDHPTLSDSLDYLQNMDKTWRDFVDSNSMSDSEIKIQTAIWELVTTEVYYIHALQTVTDLFLACLEAVQEERLLIEVDQHRLFSNIRSVCEANIKFWTLWLYPMVAHSVKTHEPLRCAFFQDGFITFASTFAPYKVYCAEQSTCQFYCKELNQNNALFTAYLAWCESQKMCNRLRLADIVVRPMQRLTKYSLLLAAIRKQMDDVEEIEVMDIMIHSVENFVGSVNNHLTMRQESERLKGVMARIESYEVVDTNNEVLEKLIKQHSQMFDLCAPMKGCPAYQVRHLFMEGDHKFKDNVSKSDVHCFLLTDILLVCKTIARKGLGALKVIRQPYLTDHLIVHLAPNNTLNCVYLNEFHVATTAFTLQCTEAKNWYDALWRAKTIYQRLKRGISGNGADSFRFGGSGASGATGDSLGVRKSPINSSMCSHVSSANNSHSGSVEWNDSRNISVDFEKTNSLSSDEGFSLMANHGLPTKGKQHLLAGLPKPKIGAISSTSANTLSVQPVNHLGQSLPNLSMPHSQTVPLRRGMAFSTSTKNPPLLKTRNITSQNSINWHQIPATPTPPSPRSHHNSPSNIGTVNMQGSMPALMANESQLASGGPPLLQKQISHQTPLQSSQQGLQRHPSNETDV
ncbi:uncharacterized protein LOC117788320 isoform X2 [Drosophila innubila]|uniref:uncharacterized protein LOC117788320 isoform X2 n=1 Tax=Drosophila innubila TaxID=198719 RepID=UPI00148CFEAA|nr:uncharacterized protein LOC117788320 isoform X2 [Drosophila innubila]